MNKVELAVCRIRQILPKDEGSLTRGSGCAVKCERLSSALGWKCSFLLVTSSNVLHCDELAAGKTFVADFLLKDKKGLESFELNLASDTCADVLGRNTADIAEFSANSSAKEQSMTIISVEKLDKRGFLKRMTKKSSLQTTRPLECFDTAKLSEEVSDGLFCHITREGGQEFSTRTYKFLFETESHRFVLHDFGNTEISSIRGFPNDEMPLGAVIYTKRGEFAGLLEFSDEAIEPCFFPVEFRLSSTANGEPASEALSNNNASTVPVSEEQADTRDEDDEKNAEPQATKNEDEGKATMHVEVGGEMAQGGVDSNAMGHKVPVDSSGAASVEAAPDTSHQTEESAAEELPEGDALPSCQSTVVSDDQDDVVAEEQAAGEASVCQISEQESCSVDDNSTAQEDAEVGDMGPEETVIQADEGGKNEHKTPVDLLETTSELLTPNSSVDDSTNAEGEILLSIMATTDEAVLVEPSKPVEQSHAAEQVNESAAVEEHSSSVVELTAASGVEPSQAAEDGSEESTQTSAAGKIVESEIQSGLDDEKPADLRAEQDEGIPEPVGVPEEIQPNNEAESSTETEEEAPVVVVCSPEAHTDQDPVADLTSTASEDADVNNDREDSSDGEPRESCELEEQQINVVEVAGDAEDVAEDAKLEEEQEEPDQLDEKKQEGPGEGEEDERGLEPSEVGRVSESGEGSEYGVEESLNREEDEDVGEDKETGKTAMTDENGKDEEELKTGDQEGEEAEKSADEPRAVEVNGEPEKDEDDEAEKPRAHEEETRDGEGENDAKVSSEGKENEEVEEADGSENRESHQRAEEVPLTKEEVEQKNEEHEEKGGEDLSDIVPQKFDGDSLLSETITNNSRLLDELAKCLDTDYQYSLLPNWRDMADLLAIPPEAYEHYDVYSVSSPTEDLFVFLSSTRPDLSMKEIREALAEIGRQDVVKIIDKFRMRRLISDESVVGSLVEREDRDLLGKLALALDRGPAVTWRHLAEQLAIPRRVYRNFGSGQGSNSALLLLKYLPIFDPDLTIGDLKELLEKILRHEAAEVLSSAGIPDDEHVRYILDDTELMDQISDLLNEDPPSPNWRQLAKELRVPQEKCRLFENTDETRSCTKLLLRSLEKSEPDLTVEELILALVAMKRQDVLDVLAKYLDGDNIDAILEDNNLLLDESLNLSGGESAN